MLDQELVDGVSFLAGDHGHHLGHGVSPFDLGTEGAAAPGAATSRGASGTVSPASKAFPSVPGPGAFARRRGRYFSLSRPNVGGRKRRLKACRRTSLRPHVAPRRCPSDNLALFE